MPLFFYYLNIISIRISYTFLDYTWQWCFSTLYFDTACKFIGEGISAVGITFIRNNIGKRVRTWLDTRVRGTPNIGTWNIALLFGFFGDTLWHGTSYKFVGNTISAVGITLTRDKIGIYERTWLDARAKLTPNRSAWK